MTKPLTITITVPSDGREKFMREGMSVDYRGARYVIRDVVRDAGGRARAAIAIQVVYARS